VSREKSFLNTVISKH